MLPVPRRKTMLAGKLINKNKRGTDLGTTLGQKLCKEANLVFADVFSQQFCLSQTAEDLPGFSTAKLGDWFLQVGTTLPQIVTTIDDGNTHIALLGIAVDEEGACVTAKTLKAQKTHSMCIDYVNKCAGRYLFIIVGKDFARIYLDALGSLGVLYDPKSKRIASTLNLLLDRDLVPNTDYPLAAAAYRGERRFAYGHTPDKFAKRLLPNHFLSILDFSTHRFWPTDDTICEASGSLALDYRDRIANRLVAITDGLFQHTDDVRFGLSGGLDSRTLLACVGPSLSKLGLFTHAENMMSRKDTRIAKRLASYVDQPIKTIDPTRDPTYRIDDLDRLMKLSSERHIGVGENLLNEQVSKTHLEVINAQEPGGLVLRGNGIDFLKGHHWGHAMPEYVGKLPHDPRNGVLGMALMPRAEVANLDPEAYQSIEAAYVDWYSDFSGVAAERSVDFMFIEHILAHSFGNLFYGFTRNFYICPFSDRNLLAMAISLSPQQRAKLFFTEGIIAEHSPKLRDMWYTRKRIGPYLTALREKNAKWYEDV